MTSGSPPARSETRRAVGTGWGLALGALAWSALLHRGLGPSPGAGEVPWTRPSGFLLEWLASGSLAVLGEDVRLGVAAAAAPAAALTLAVFLVTRRVAPRLIATCCVVACALFAFYGIQAPFVWSFFGWRWSASMAGFAVVVAAAALAPLLAERWLRLGWPARVLSYAPVFAALVLLERNVTGTDPSLRFSLSPWPAVQIFGLEITASTLAALILGVATGLALLGLAGERAAAVRGGAALAGAGLAGVFPAAPLWLGSTQGLLPFQTGPRLLGATAAAAALTYVFASWNAGGGRRWRRCRVWAVAAALLGIPLVVGQALTRLDYGTTREDRAQRIIDALDLHYARETVYPDELEDLVAAGDLAEVPRPRIGFALASSPEFVYEGFGTSYLLEFSAPRWIQCAYSPPYRDEDGNLEEGESLEEAWSCPSKPPDLW